MTLTVCQPPTDMLVIVGLHGTKTEKLHLNTPWMKKKEIQIARSDD